MELILSFTNEIDFTKQLIMETNNHRLPRSSCTESSVTSTLLDEIKKAQAKDEQCIRILTKNLSSEEVVKDYRVRNGVVTLHDKYFIPPNILIKNRLLQLSRSFGACRATKGL